MSDIKPLNWTTKTLALVSLLSLGLQALYMRKPSGDVTWLTAQSVTQAQWTLHSPLKAASIVTWRISCAGCSIWNRKNPPLFPGHYLRNRSTLDIGVLGYIGILFIRNTLPKSGTFLLGHPVYIYIYIYIYMIVCSDVTIAWFSKMFSWRLINYTLYCFGHYPLPGT